ncbi:penicillin-binding protein, partial [Streptococcus suis]
MAGKTGTSNYTDSETEQIIAANPEAAYNVMVVPDENFVGYSSQYAMAVWTGYTNRMTPILDNSMRIASDVYHNMMTFMHSDYTATDWEVPSGVVNFGGNYYLRNSTSLQNAYSNYYNSLTPSSSSRSSSNNSSTSASTTTTNQTTTESSTSESTTQTSSTQTETSTESSSATTETSSSQQNSGNTENSNQ